MSIVINSREDAQVINGAHIFFVPDGTPFGTDASTSGLKACPDFEHAVEAGKLLGTVREWKVATEYKTLEKTGCKLTTQRYETETEYILDKVKVTFSTQDVTPEAYALEYGIETVPEQGADAVKPFSNASGQLKGWLYVRLLDSLRTHGEDGELAQLRLRGNLRLAETPNHTNEYSTVSYEFNVTAHDEATFENLGITTNM